MTQRNSEARRAMLAGRRQRQRSLTSGFQPVRNQRISDAVSANLAIIRLQNPLMSAVDAQQEAWGRVAKMLPAVSTHRNLRRKTSKNDSASYRGVGGAGPRRQQALGQ